MKVYFIRHGSTPGNLLHQYVGGKTDQPLSEEGRLALSELKKSGIYPQAEKVFVSPMLRCHETAALLFPEAEQTVVEGLKEMDFGIFEGRSAAEMEGDPIYQEWVDGMCEGQIPEGENKEDFTERCIKAFLELMDEQNASETAVFAIHGGTIMAILSRLGNPPRSYYDWYVKNGHGYECEWNGKALEIIKEF